MTDLLLDTWAAVMWKACWQGSLVVLAVWLICQVIPSMPARGRCWLWRMAILKFMVVLLLPTLFNLPLLPAPPVASPMPEVAVQIVQQQVPVRPVDHVEFRPSRAVELPSIPAILAFLWIIGFGWSLAHLLVAWRGARKIRKQSRIVKTTPLIEQLARQAKLYGLRTSPRLLETEGDGSPMLIGILRPAIVVPSGTLRKLSPPELAMVLGHELAHIRCGDLLWNLAAAGVQALFFFHPLVWLSQRRLNLAQEVAADELAILRQHGDPVTYGKLLVSVISKLGPSRLIPTMSMGTAGSVKSLTRRLVAMANIGRASRGIIVASGIILAATVLLGLVPWQLVAAEPKQEAKGEQDGTITKPPYSSASEIYVSPQASAPSPSPQTKQAKSPPSRADQDAFDAELTKAATALRRELTPLQTEITKLGGKFDVCPIAGPYYEHGGGFGGFHLPEPNESYKLTVAVNLIRSKVTDTDLKRLEGLMTRCNFLGLTATQITDAGLKHIEGLHNLRALSLRRTNITDAGLKHLQGMNQLVDLDLFDTDVTDRGLEYLEGLTAIQSLNLGETRITDAGLKSLEAMKQLTKLDLFDTQVSNDGVKYLKGLKKLRYLSRERTRMDVLEVWKVLPECQ